MSGELVIFPCHGRSDWRHTGTSRKRLTGASRKIGLSVDSETSLTVKHNFTQYGGSGSIQ